MTKKLLFVTTILFVVAFVALAADVSGKWTYTMSMGGQDRQTTITLKQDGDKLTGSVPGFARGGGAAQDTEISNGKVSGDTVTFEVKRQGPNGETVTKYEGTVSGDSMKLKITRPGRDGSPQTNEVAATRAKS